MIVNQNITVNEP